MISEEWLIKNLQVRKKLLRLTEVVICLFLKATQVEKGEMEVGS